MGTSTTAAPASHVVHDIRNYIQLMLLLGCQIIVDRALSQGTLNFARLNSGCVT